MKKDKKTREKGSSIINRESVGFTVGVFCILLFVISVTKSLFFGSLGEAIYQFQFGVFGFANYFVLIWLLFVCVRLVIGKNPVPIKHFTSYLTAFLLCLMLTIHAFATAGEATSYGEYIAAAFEKGEYGPVGSPFGAFGSLIVFPLRSVLTAGGAYAVLILLTVFFLSLTVRSFLAFRGVNVKIFGKDGLIARIQNRRTDGKTPEEQESFPLPDNTREACGGSAQTAQTTQTAQAETIQQPNVFRPVPVENYTRRDEPLQPSYMPTNGNRESNYNKSIQFLYGARENPDEYRHRNLIFDESSNYNARAKNEATNGAQRAPTYRAEPTYGATASYSRSETTPPPANPSYGSSVYSRMTSDAMNNVNTPSVQEKRVVDERRGEGYSMYHTDVYDTASENTPQERTPFRAEEYRGTYTDRRSGGEPRENEMPVYGRNETGRTEFESSSAEEPSRRDDLRDRFIASSDETETTRASAPERTNRVDRDERSDRATENPFERSDRNYTPDRSAPLQNRANLFDDEAEEDETETSEPDFTADRTRGVADRGTARGGFAEEPPKVVKEELPKPRIIKDYVRPSSDMLLTYNDNMGISTEESEATQRAIVDTLAGFHITVGIKRVLSGPVFTRYDINLPKSVDFGRIAKYKREMAMAIRTGGTINIYPNYQEGSVSIEVPNSKRSTVGLKPILQSPAYQNAKPGSLMFAIGMDAEGKCIVDDLCKMPHMLVAGTTGSGKSVFLHELIMSLIMKYSPEEVRLILIDPKWTEFSVYENLPHLMINEIIANPNRVIVALNWAIAEMEHRYTLFAQMTQKGVAVRNIDEYNSVVEKKEDKLPKIVLIADEVADLMAVAKNDIENRVGRIAAKARAAGIHLVLATQRPSVNVITGVLKSNLPSRFALRVSAEVDSRVILDSTGAENLLGKGDLLYKTGSMYEPKRVQSAWIDTPEIQKICDFIREHNEAYYDEKVAAYIDSEGKTTINNESSEETEEKGLEPVYIDALRFVVMTGSASISMIQRKCSIGFNKAGKIVDWMEQNGYISPFDGGAKSRKVLLTKEEFIEKFGEL